MRKDERNEEEKRGENRGGETNDTNEQEEEVAADREPCSSRCEQKIC